MSCLLFFPLKEDLSAGHLSRMGQKSHDGEGGDALSASGLSHDADDLALVHVEAHVADGLNLSQMREERGVQMFYFQ